MLSTSDRDVATAMLAPDYLTAVQKNDNELIKRLMAAQRLLEKAEQGEEEPHELFHFAKQLGQPWMMSHKHKVGQRRDESSHSLMHLFHLKFLHSSHPCCVVPTEHPLPCCMLYF